MINSVKARTPILALILFVFAVGYTFAETRVVVIPLGADAAPQSLAVFASGIQSIIISATDETIRTVTLTVPSDGVVIVNSTVIVSESTAGDGVVCSITTASIVNSQHRQIWESPGSDGSRSQLAGTRGFNVTGDLTYNFKLVCKHTGSTSPTLVINDSSLTAIFTPSA